MAEISVVGIGNIIMQDEGFGVRCAEVFADYYRLSRFCTNY